jgi:anti-sigma factor RsiW
VTQTTHPSSERLANLARGLLGALERSRLERHISECARCSAELVQLTTPAGETASAGRVDDDGMLTRARRLLARGPASQPIPPITRLSGSLRFDSATMPPAFGMRGGLDDTTRQLLFEAGPFEVELHTQAARSGWNVKGQVLGPTEATSGEVRLIGARSSARSMLSELLEFSLPLVPAGTYRLELRLAHDALIQIDKLDLGT